MAIKEEVWEAVEKVEKEVREAEQDESPELSAPVPESPKPEVPKPGPADASPSAKRRVLIADDQKMNLMVLKAMISKLGAFEIVMAADGRKALDILEAADAPQFDMVLTDMWMPEVDGEGLVRAIRANERLASLPVYVVTADVEMLKKHQEVSNTQCK
jgi:CheY-like chemotaxis protein